MLLTSASEGSPFLLGARPHHGASCHFIGRAGPWGLAEKLKGPKDLEGDLRMRAGVKGFWQRLPLGCMMMHAVMPAVERPIIRRAGTGSRYWLKFMWSQAEVQGSFRACGLEPIFVLLTTCRLMQLQMSSQTAAQICGSFWRRYVPLPAVRQSTEPSSATVPAQEASDSEPSLHKICHLSQLQVTSTCFKLGPTLALGDSCDNEVMIR